MSSSAHCIRCLAKAFLFSALLALGSLLVAYIFRAPILNTFTDLWVVDDGRVQADAVVVLGGGANTRTFAAADAFHAGLAKKVLIPNVKLSPIQELGLVRSHTEICESVVLEEGVPQVAVERFGDQVSSTWEEIEAVKVWCEENKAEAILAPTEFPFTRRLRWVFDQVMAGMDTKVHVYPINHLEYNQENWWRNEHGLIAFQNDFLKYLLYRLKY